MTERVVGLLSMFGEDRVREVVVFVYDDVKLFVCSLEAKVNLRKLLSYVRGTKDPVCEFV